MAGSGSTPPPDKDPPSGSPSPHDRRSTRHTPLHVLVVEDNHADVILIGEALQTVALTLSVHVVTDGEQAMRFFDRADADLNMPCPALVILDINLPKRQGSDVLKHLRQSQRCREALVVTVSTSDSAKDRQRMNELGANSYFKKPSDYDEFMKLGELVATLLSQDQPS